MNKWTSEHPLRVFEAFAGYGSQHMAFDAIKPDIPGFDFKVVGISEENIDKLLNAGISDSQLYKLAGNSIVVQCMAGIFRNAFSTEEVESMTLF